MREAQETWLDQEKQHQSKASKVNKSTRAMLMKASIFLYKVMYIFLPFVLSLYLYILVCTSLKKPVLYFHWTIGHQCTVYLGHDMTRKRTRQKYIKLNIQHKVPKVIFDFISIPLATSLYIYAHIPHINNYNSLYTYQ